MDISEKEFARIVREHKTTIYTVCYMFSKDKEEVEDLFQEVLIAMWRGFDSFRGESALRSWIYRISLNTCISADRKKHRRADSVRLDMNINLFSDTDDDSRQAQMLRERIGRLGVFDRAIILLWLENLSYEEIGAIVGITAKNVSVRLVRIREQLKNMSNE
jgi:RNA polymerase sigma-70 factor (ECF subfamily)